jgi:hypothetical protein
VQDALSRRSMQRSSFPTCLVDPIRAPRAARGYRLVVMGQIIEAEITARIGPKHAKSSDRIGKWFGTSPSGLSP